MEPIDVPAVGIGRMLWNLFDEGLVRELEDLLEVGLSGRDAKPNRRRSHDAAGLCH
jgi:hypothetical protein